MLDNMYIAPSSYLEMASSPPSNSLSSITLCKGLLDAAAGRSATAGVGAAEGDPRRRLAERSNGEGVLALQHRQQVASAGHPCGSQHALPQLSHASAECVCSSHGRAAQATGRALQRRWCLGTAEQATARDSREYAGGDWQAVRNILEARSAEAHAPNAACLAHA